MKKFLGITAGAMVLAGCASSQPAAAPVAAAAAPAAAINPGVILTAARFVDVAASAALYAIEAAKLAETRSGNRDVRALAAMQKANGEGIGGQLSYAGRRVNALPDNVLTAQHQAMLDELRYARDFDATYLAQQQRMVPLMRQFHEQYARQGDSPTLRPVAEFSAEKLAAQERALGRIR